MAKSRDVWLVRCAPACYDRVNHIIMSLVWLVLTGNTPAIVATLICLQTMRFFQRTGFGESKTFFGGPRHEPYMMGLGQGNRAAPPSWLQLSAVMVNVYKQLGLGTDLHDPISLYAQSELDVCYATDPFYIDGSRQPFADGGHLGVFQRGIELFKNLFLIPISS